MIEIMIPVWREKVESQLANSTLQTLEGVTVALVDDDYDFEYTNEVEKVLGEEYGAIVKRFLKPYGSAPSPKSLIDEAAKCDVAIVGIAL
jgi:hypothetical protein